MDSTISTDSSFQFLRVRCPHCSKLYSVDERQIRVVQPQFECIQCHSLFFFNYLESLGSQDVTAFLVDGDKLPSTTLAAASQSDRGEALIKAENMASADSKDLGHTTVFSRKKASARGLNGVEFSFGRQKELEFIENELEAIKRQIQSSTPSPSLESEKRVVEADSSLSKNVTDGVFGSVEKLKGNLKKESLSSPPTSSKKRMLVARGRQELGVGSEQERVNVDLQKPQHVIGETDWTEDTGRAFCPRCDAPFRVGEKECARCGIIFSQFLPSSPEAVDMRVPHQLIDLWQKVLVDFSSTQRHEQFVEACLERKQLAFAARKYKILRDANPSDDMVQDMIKRIQVLSSVGATVIKTERIELWKLRLFGFVVALGLMLIAVGFSFEGLRNLVGLGATFTFLAIGIRLVFS